MFTGGRVREFTGAGELFKELTGGAAAVLCVCACRYP